MVEVVSKKFVAFELGSGGDYCAQTFDFHCRREMLVGQLEFLDYESAVQENSETGLLRQDWALNLELTESRS